VLGQASRGQSQPMPGQTTSGPAATQIAVAARLHSSIHCHGALTGKQWRAAHGRAPPNRIFRRCRLHTTKEQAVLLPAVVALRSEPTLCGSLSIAQRRCVARHVSAPAVTCNKTYFSTCSHTNINSPPQASRAQPTRTARSWRQASSTACT
jgi:hypothetical protein